jgi:hypothetical protein
MQGYETGLFISAVAFDPVRSQVVVYQIADGAPETWTFDGAAWKRQSPAHQPSARRYAELAWDPADKVVVLWGGSIYVNGHPSASQNRSNETWLWDGSDWSHSSAGSAPPGSEAGTIGTSAAGVVAYTSDVAYQTQTGLYAHDEWSQVAGTSPPYRSEATMVFDSTARTTLMIGGTNSGGTEHLWSFDGAAWHKIYP